MRAHVYLLKAYEEWRENTVSVWDRGKSQDELFCKFETDWMEKLERSVNKCSFQALEMLCNIAVL